LDEKKKAIPGRTGMSDGKLIPVRHRHLSEPAPAINQLNTNEVSPAAHEIATGKRGGKGPPPQRSRNMGKAPTTAIPAIHVSAASANKESCFHRSSTGHRSAEKADQYDDVVKIAARFTRWQTSASAGAFGYARRLPPLGRAMPKAIRASRTFPWRTAVGTGIKSHPDFAKQAIGRHRSKSGLTRRTRKILRAASARRSRRASGFLKPSPIGLTRSPTTSALSSGPRCGIGELRHPRTQPAARSCPARPIHHGEMALMVAPGVGKTPHRVAPCPACGSSSSLNVMIP